ncbi:MAG: serine O-acetyltransferase [Phycisphaerales bacterium]|nr:serine O-acetyltransferase [Phycisphaerales bacterium]
MSLRSTLNVLYWDYVTHGRRWANRGLWAMAIYRYGRWVDSLRPSPFKILFNKSYSLLSVFGPVVTGVFLDRATKVGKQLHIVHPGMVLIHPHAQIGDRVGIMHGVTLGTTPAHTGCPTVGDDVFIGAYATVLGGIKIGNGAKIAANSLVICDVPAGATAIGVPAKVYPATPLKPAIPMFRKSA